MKSEREILNDLSFYSGTEEYHKIPFSDIVYTDGINNLINLCECHWLISDTAIFMTNEKGNNNILRGEEFLILKIKVNEDRTAEVTLRTDTDEKNLYFKKYLWTDFPLKEYEFYIVSKVMLLKGEY